MVRPDLIRTADLLVRSQTLYPTELWAHCGGDSFYCTDLCPRNSPRNSATIFSVPMTERLYYTDSYLRDFTARIVDRSADGRTVYLDRTAFYPTSGGQPFDTGSIAGVAVLDVVDEDERIAHRLAAPAPCRPRRLRRSIGPRRFDHMQQHTGQHLLSAVFEELFALQTVSFHLGAESATIDSKAAPSNRARSLEAERRANEIVFENRPVTVQFENAAEAQGLRKASEPRRHPAHRLHRRPGPQRLRRHPRPRHRRDRRRPAPQDSRRSASPTRVEFLCGARAVRRARADYEALTEDGAALLRAARRSPGARGRATRSRARRRKGAPQARTRPGRLPGQGTLHATAPGPDGMRRVVKRLERGSLEELRAVAQNFTAQPKAVFLAAMADPPSILLAASADAGIDAGKFVKAALAEVGGRGGGNARIAQGSIPNATDLDEILARL